MRRFIARSVAAGAVAASSPRASSSATNSRSSRAGSEAFERLERDLDAPARGVEREHRHARVLGRCRFEPREPAAARRESRLRNQPHAGAIGELGEQGLAVVEHVLPMSHIAAGLGCQRRCNDVLHGVGVLLV